MGSNASGVRVGGDNSGAKRMPVASGGIQMSRLARAGQSKTGDNARKGLVRDAGGVETLACTVENRRKTGLNSQTQVGRAAHGFAKQGPGIGT
jgi:hypothetical protein